FHQVRRPVSAREKAQVSTAIPVHGINSDISSNKVRVIGVLTRGPTHRPAHRPAPGVRRRSTVRAGTAPGPRTDGPPRAARDKEGWAMAATGTPVSNDVYPPDFASPIGRIRALIPDVEQVDYSDEGTAQYLFSDAHLSGLYAISSGNDPARLYRAAASALRALAVSEGLIQKVIRTEDLQTDGAKLASALLSGAKALEDRADMAEE